MDYTIRRAPVRYRLHRLRRFLQELGGDWGRYVTRLATFRPGIAPWPFTRW